MKRTILHIIQFFLLVFITARVDATNILAKNGFDDGIFQKASSNVDALSATISGSATVCQSTTPEPLVLFTATGGVAPYTFTYQLNGVNQTIVTSVTSASVSLKAQTTIPGTYTYTLVSVKDKSGLTLTVTSTATIVVNPLPDPTINSSAELSTLNGKTFFKICSNTLAELTFTNTSTTIATNANYVIDWGDGSNLYSATSWSSLNHIYAVGLWTMTYTITNQSGCSITKKFDIYIGSNPAVSLGSPGNTDNCSNVPLTFPITGTENNPPGTTYTVSFNDGTPAQVFNHPPPAEITHTFTKTSCGVTSYNGTSPYPNSFSASIVASNMCGVSAVNVVPIYISTSPVVDFNIPTNTLATNKPVYFTNTTTGYVNVGANCAVVPKLVWIITPATGFTLSSGTLGNDFGQDNSNLWTKGSDVISPIFTVPGTYKIKLRVDTKRCGNDQLEKTICVEAPLKPQFSLQTNGECTPVQVKATNFTDLSTSCSTTTKWSVNYLAENCGNAPAEWSFANGTNEQSANPIFNVVTPGIYKIVLSMTNTAGTFTSEKQIIVKKPPTATIENIPDNCGTATIHPIAHVNSCTVLTSVLNYRWDFPGGTPSTSTSLDPGLITYNSLGDFTATLTVTNECGSVVTNSNTFHVNPLPTVEAVENQLKNSNDLSDLISFRGTIGAVFEWNNSNPTIGLAKSGSGDILPFKLINNSDSVLTAIITVTPKMIATGCIGTVMIFKIQVNPIGDVNLIENQVVNNGNSTKKIEFSTVSTGGTTKYNWINDLPEIGLPDSGTGNIDSFVAQNNSTVPVVATITVTPFFENGGQSSVGVPKKFTITVNPTAQVNSVNDIELCNGINLSGIKFSSKNTVGKTTFAWTNNNTEIGLSATGNDSILNFKVINKGLSQLIAQVTVVPTFTYLGASNTGKAEKFNISVNPGPAITVQPASSYICPGGDASLLKVAYSGGVGTPSYQWFTNKSNSMSGATSISGATSDTYNPGTTVPGTNYYFCIITLPTGVCSDITSDIATVAVNEAAIITEQPLKLQNLCVGGTIQAPLSIKYTGGSGLTNYQWYSNTTNSAFGGTEIVGANDSVYMPPIFTNPGNNYYYVRLTLSGDGCGSSFSQVAEIRVVSDPTVIEQPVASQTICKDVVPTNLTVAVGGGLGQYTYQWFSNTVNENSSGKLIQGETSNTFTPSTSLTGTTYYYCEISQPDGLYCKVTSEPAEVIVNSAPVITAQPVSSTVCFDYTPEILTVKCSYGVGKPVYQWYSSSVNSTIFGSIIPGATSASYKPETLKAGITYYYCVINFNDGGCSTLISAIATVTINPVPKITSRKITISNGSELVVIPDQSAGDIVPEGTNYIWSAPVIHPLNSVSGAIAQSVPTNKIDQRLTNLTDSSATVVYTVTPLTGTCVGSDFTIEVTVLPEIKVEAVVQNVSCFGAENGSIQTTIYGGLPTNTVGYFVQWKGPNGFIASTKDISGLKPGEYKVTFIDQGGLPVSYQYTITEPAQIKIITDVKKDVNCSGNNTGKLSVTVVGGVQPYSYTWKKDGVYFAGTEDITDLASGVYVLSVTDANGCGLGSELYNIVEPVALDIRLIAKTNVRCFGDSTGSISVNVTGGVMIEKTPGIFDYNYVWSGPNGFKSFDKNLKKLVVGSYKLTVTDAGNCNQTIEIQINGSSELNLSTEVSPVTCFGSNNASIKLNITGGTMPYQIQWSNLGSGLIQQNLSPGDYTITVIDANDCQKTTKINIPEADFSIHPILKNISCNGANDGSIKLNITGGLQPVTLVWADNPTAGDVRNQLSPGIYTVTLRDGAPCEITESYMISEPKKIGITAKISNAFVCDNSTSGSIDITVRGGSSPYTYQWSNGSTTEDLNDISAGKYYILVTDSKGCSSSGLFEIMGKKPVTVFVSSDLSLDCNQKKLKMTSKAQVEGGFPPYHYTWNGGAISGENNKIMETSQNSVVNLVVSDSLGCSANYTFSINVPEIGIDYQPINCSKYYYQFNAVKSSVELNGITCFWDFGDGTTSSLENPAHFFAKAGNYKVKLTIADVSCSATFEETIYVSSESRLKLDRDPKICIGDSLVLKINGADSYRWSDGTNADSIVIKLPGDYIAIGTTLNGCKDTLNFTASYYDLYNYTIQSDSDKVTSGGYPLHLWSDKIPFTQYFWDFGDGKVENGVDVFHTFNIQTDGFYDVKLRAVNPNGCTETTTKRIWITVPVLPNTFSPNGDGINEKFLENWKIQVYSRNGIILYSGTDGWDGKYKGQDVSGGIYFYVLYYPSESGTKTSSGYVRLIR